MNKQKSKTWSPQTALSMIEIMIGLSILGVLGGVVVYYTKTALENRYRIEALATRDGLANRIRKVISKQNLIYSSQTFAGQGNQRLADCLEPAGVCNATNIDRPVGFFLGYPGGKGPKRIAGPTRNPIYYDHKGGVCDTRDCREFSVQVLFSAICANNQLRCNQAQSLRVRYQLNNVQLRGQPLLESIPTQAEFADKRRNNIIIRLRKVFYDSECPPLAVIKDFSKTDNNIICG